jgi:hypothetical protein
MPLSGLLLLCLGAAAAAAAADVDSAGTGARRLLEANKLPGSSPSNPQRFVMDVSVGVLSWSIHVLLMPAGAPRDAVLAAAMHTVQLI